MAEEKEEITCECQEIHEDLLKIVNETMPDEEELYDLAMISHKQLSPEEMTKFVQRSNEILMLLTK